MIFALLVQAGLAHAQEREDQILLRDLQDILSHYVTANGGLENLQRILSVRVSGTIFTTGMDQPAEIILFRKRPEFKRVSMRMPDRSLEIGFDGTTVWRTIRTNFGRQVNVVDGDEAVYFTEDAAFDSPLMLAYTNSPLVTGVRLIGTERIDRVTCYVIEMLYGQNIRRVFLDARNWREIRIDSLDPESRELRSRTTLGDYFQHEGVWYARSALQVRADGHETEIRLERIDTNVGMFDSFFSPPAELR
ncbi:MAG: hypothetical protein LR015_02930 [Verrucomicrobia bacterium]|nr:hypothetical protein [Verrucomicrobiota bacterium]